MKRSAAGDPARRSAIRHHFGNAGSMKRLLRYFLQGLVITIPLVLTVFVCVQAFRKVDSWLGISIPGVGFAVTLASITLIGFFGSSVLTKTVIVEFERLLERLPLSLIHI